ncbi:MAG: glycoside hydrolase family 3 N-terminal domain-containing protein [Pseudomonadota bacterium]
MSDHQLVTRQAGEPDAIENRIAALVQEMSLEEKIGQLRQVDATGDSISDYLRREITAGRIGSVINQINPALVKELQDIAVHQSRLGIPLLIGRDVIHGFNTVAPIPLGQAASWNAELVRDAARCAGLEASACGVNWTFAPMIDISRDPRWGRIAESLGEDPYLTAELGAAMIEGFQGDDLTEASSIAACAKHFAGYGASESGRDYNTTNIPENELRNIYLPPFEKAVEAGVATFMSSFSDIDGVPATASGFLMRQVLRDEWNFSGFVVSDWNSIGQLSVHGLTENDREAAFQACTAGIDMEMASNAYIDNLADLVAEGRITIATVDEMVSNILRIKFSMGLFDERLAQAPAKLETIQSNAFEVARKLATESVVLLKNDHGVLPLDGTALKSIAVIGPMADAPYEQLGTWVFDGDPDLSVTPLQAIRAFAGDNINVHFAQAMPSTRSRATDGFDDAIAAASNSDAIALFLGEEAILSGEAHSRADISLPGNQAELIRTMRTLNKPLILVVLAGRPLTLGDVLNDVDAVFYAWHPGTMAGPAICDLLFGAAAPSGKLPVTFPKVVGQIPTYYNHKNTGRPPESDTVIHIDDIEIGARQTSLGMTAFHLDAGYKPQFPFGFGLTYTDFAYSDLTQNSHELRSGEALRLSAKVQNCGARAASETVQLYVRDLVGSITRPVKELKGFQKIYLEPGEIREVAFTLDTDDLKFFRRDKTYGAEPGEFHFWIGRSSEDGLFSRFWFKPA